MRNEQPDGTRNREDGFSQLGSVNPLRGALTPAQQTIRSAATTSLFEACVRRAEQLCEIDAFKDWTRDHVRPLLPHGVLACAYGRLYGAGVSLDYVLTVDYPLEHLQAIRNSSGHMDTPLAHRWYRQQSPVFFDADSPPEGTPAAWLTHFRKHGLRNAVADGVLDTTTCIGTYFSFHQIPVLDQTQITHTLKTLTPLLHETFARVIYRRRHPDEGTAALRYGYKSTIGSKKLLP